MATNHDGMPMLEDPAGPLDRAFIDEFLTMRGRTISDIADLTEAEKARLLVQACTYAAARLAEMEARAHYVVEIHGIGRR
jgi:hypothetical protein